MCTGKTQLSLPEDVAEVYDDSHPNQNNSVSDNHFHPSLPHIPPEEDDGNGFGSEIIELRVEQKPTELEGSRTECLTESQRADQPEPNSLSEEDSPLPSPHLLDSREPSSLENEHAHKTQAAAEEAESLESSSENLGDKKKGNNGITDIKDGEEITVSTLDLSHSLEDDPGAVKVRDSSSDLESS